MPNIETTPELVEAVYERTRKTLEVVRERLARPLTLSEKILLGHLTRPERQKIAAGEAYLQLRPDRVALQDATAQMALLQFMLAGEAGDRGTGHRALRPPDPGPDRGGQGSGPGRHRQPRGLRLPAHRRPPSTAWGSGSPGAGIIHQVVLENYAFPGGLMIGTDSHTPNAGGLGMCAVGVGGADAVDVMAGFPWEVLQPKLIGVRLTGSHVGLDRAPRT